LLLSFFYKRQILYLADFINIHRPFGLAQTPYVFYTLLPTGFLSANLLVLAEDILFDKFWLVRLAFERLGNVYGFSVGFYHSDF